MNMESKKEKIVRLLSQPHTRKELCKDSKFFFSYYFKNDIKYKEFAPFQKERFAKMKESKVFVKGMRWVAKTTIRGIANIVQRICYERNAYISILCYDLSASKALATAVRNELARNERIIQDFGKLYTEQSTRDDWYDEKTVGSFITNNGVKVQSFWMGTSLRWKIHAHPTKWKCRPDFLLVDDIDTNDNTKNPRIIADDMDFIYNEVFWWMDQDNSSIVRLWNVIRQDGRNVRHENVVENSQWIIFDNFLYWKSGNTYGDLCWSRYTEWETHETEKGKVISVSDLRKSWLDWFEQNALGIPKVAGDVLYQSDLTKYRDITFPNGKTWIWIDPAFSLKTWSDGIGIVVNTRTNDGKRYIQKAFALYDKDKDEDNVRKVVQELYNEYNAYRVVIENNNGWWIIERIVSKAGMASEIIKTTKDKATRFLEIKGEFLSWNVFFHPTLCTPLIRQLETFTWMDGWQDDIVDALICTMQHKKRWQFM